MSGIQRFTRGLAELGYAFEQEGERVKFSLLLKEGQFKDREVKVGLIIPTDFNLTPPTGPHINPRLIPLNTGATDHSKLATSDFGNEWGYLSRPFQNWNDTDKTVKEYLRWVKHLLHTLKNTASR